MDVRRISPPLTRQQKLAVLQVSDVKAQERVLHSEENSLIERYIVSAFDHLHGPNGWLNGYCLLEEEFEFFPGTIYATTELPLRPVEDDLGVTLERRLARGAYEAIGAGDFMVANVSDVAVLARLTTSGFAPQANVIDPRQYRITFKAGHAAPEEVPSPLVQAMLLLAGHWYQNREASVSDPRVSNVSKKVEFGLQSLAGRYRFSPDHS